MNDRMGAWAVRCFAALTICAISPRARAAEPPDLINSPLRPHTLGLQFGFKGGTPLSTFTGTTLSLKYQRSTHTAWRTGLSFSGAARQSDQDQVSLNEVLTTQQTRRTRDLALATDLVRLFYVAPDAPIKPFVGIGPALAFSRDQDDVTGYFIYGSSGQIVFEPRSTRSYSRTWSYGIEAILGAEWVVLKRLGFHAEYAESGEYQAIRGTTELTTPSYVSKYVLKKHAWEFGPSSIRSGVTVYF